MCAFLGALAAAMFCGVSFVSGTGDDFMRVAGVTQPPPGWVQFCQDYWPECETKPVLPLRLVPTPRGRLYLTGINLFVNENVKPMTDQEHWGVAERWNYPDDGYGDCEDYVLRKRQLLMQAGWPRSALLIAVVRDRKNLGHAVLLVETTSGEYVLDNERNDIVPWWQTGYRFFKRQSEQDQNVWLALEEPFVVSATSK